MGSLQRAVGISKLDVAAGLSCRADDARTVIIWKDFKKVLQIEGHEQAVWAVKFVGEDRVLTGELASACANRHEI